MRKGRGYMVFFRIHARVICLFSFLTVFSFPSFADLIELNDGSSFTDLRVLSYDGRGRDFKVAGNGGSVDIGLNEVASMDFDSERCLLTLRDGSVYSGVRILGFDGARDRFQVRRGGNLADVRATEVSAIDFTTSDLNEVINGNGAIADDVLLAPRTTAVLIPPLETVETEQGETEETFETEPEFSVPDTVADVEAKTLERARKARGSENQESRWTPGERRKTSRRAQLNDFDAWNDDTLYSNIPKNFGEARVVTGGDKKKDQKTEGYVPRWRDSAGKSRSSSKSSARSAAPKRSIAKTTRPSTRSSSRSSRRRGSGTVSDRALAEADPSSRGGSSTRGRGGRSRSTYDSRGDRSGGRGGANAGSRFGYDNRYGESQYGGGRSYGGSNFGGGNFGSDRFSSSVGGSRYGGSSRYGGGF